MQTFSDYKSFKAIIKDVFKKGVKTNFLGLPMGLYTDDLLYTHEGSNLFLLEALDNQYKLYYYINEDSLSNIDWVSNLDVNKPITVEVFYKAADREVYSSVLNYFESCGVLKLKRQRLKLSLEHSTNSLDDQISKVSFIDQSLFEETKALLCNDFDALFGCIPCDKLWLENINDEEVLGLTLNDTLTGLLHYSEKKSTAYLLHMLVVKSYRGKGLGSELLKAWINMSKKKTSIKYLELWVGCENKSAKRMYDTYGFKADGLESACYLIEEKK